MKKYVVVNSIDGDYIGIYENGKRIWSGFGVSPVELIVLLTGEIPVNYYPQSDEENASNFVDGRFPDYLPEMVKKSMDVSNE